METTSHHENLALDVLQLKKAALMLRAANHKLRLDILRLIHQNNRMIVSDIYAQLGLEQSAASQHLALLRRAGLVRAERQGKNIYYSIHYARLKEVNRLVAHLLQARP